MRGRRWRAAALVLLLAAPLIWWAGSALIDPEVELLVGWRAPWVVDPRWETRGRTADPFPATRYSLRREPSRTPPSSLPVEVRAMRELRIFVDGELRFDFGDWPRSGWKDPVALDLGPWLAAAGEALTIEVTNDRGPPALQVVALEEAAAPWIETGHAPWYASTRGLPPTPAVVAGRGEPELGAAPWRWARPLLHRALLGAVVALVLVGFLRYCRGRRRAERGGPPGDPHEEDAAGAAPGARRRWLWLPVAAALLLVAAANLWNASRFPYTRSHMDWGGHRQHLRYAANHWRPPLAEEGWQMYQPPLYYWAGGAVLRASRPHVDQEAALRRVQLLGAAAGVLHVLLAAAVLRRFGPRSGRAQAVALLAVGLAPGAITTNAMLTNEPFAALMCGLPLAAGAALLADRRYGVMTGAFLGLLGGLALLSKFTGLMPVAAVGAVLGVAFLDEAGRRRAVAATLAAFLLVAALVAGPYYARNVAVYGKPFVGNWDPESGQYYEQEPGYRTPRFWGTVGDVFVHPPARARYSSFWDGLYASWWGEIHDNFVRPHPPRTIRLSLLLFALAAVPTAAGAMGLVRSLRRSFGADPRHRVHLLFVVVSLFSVASLGVFMARLPYVSTMKAFFLLNLTVPAAVFIGWGLSRLEAGLGRGRVLLDLVSLGFVALVLSLFLWR